MTSIKFLCCLFFVAAVSAYNPDAQNIYHLFTRQNPTVSNVLMLNNESLLRVSTFDPTKRTVLLIHGWLGSATSEVNTVLVPAYLAAVDANVIIVDWSAGANIGAGTESPENAVLSGQSVARFINWLVAITGMSFNQFTIVGHSLGAHQAGVVGRHTNGRLPFIVALDPGANMEDSGHIFTPDVATYTEAIHTNSAIMGHGNVVADADFFPNGGDFMPGCGVNFLCNHLRGIYYFAESLQNPRAFRGRACGSVLQANLGLCVGLSTLHMGGLEPKNRNGIFHLSTNAERPFGRG